MKDKKKKWKNGSGTKARKYMRGTSKVSFKPLLTHLPFYVDELGKHQRPIESQLSHIVVVLSWSLRLLGRRETDTPLTNMYTF